MCTKRLGSITLSQLQEDEMHVGQNKHSARKHFGKNTGYFKNNNTPYAPQILKRRHARWET